MGAVIAYEAAAAAERAHLHPAALIVTGEVAPHFTVLKKESRGMDKPAFLQLIRDYAGMDSALLEDPAFMRYYYPIVRGDFTFYESYAPAGAQKLHCPICVISGDTDPHIVPEQVRAWQAYSACRTDFFTVDGGHFFVFEQAEATCRILNQYLDRMDSHDEG